MNKAEICISEELFFSSYTNYCSFTNDVKEAHLKATIEMLKALKIEPKNLSKCRSFIGVDVVNFISKKYDLEVFRVADIINRNDYKLNHDINEGFTDINKIIDVNEYLFKYYLISEDVYNYNNTWINEVI